MPKKILLVDVGDDEPVGVHCESMTFDHGDLILFTGANLDGGIAAAFGRGHWQKVWWGDEQISKQQ